MRRLAADRPRLSIILASYHSLSSAGSVALDRSDPSRLVTRVECVRLMWVRRSADTIKLKFRKRFSCRLDRANSATADATTILNLISVRWSDSGSPRDAEQLPFAQTIRLGTQPKRREAFDLAAPVQQLKVQRQRPRLAAGDRSHSCRRLDCDSPVGRAGLLPPRAPTTCSGPVVSA
jgi:hypothetical protein